MSVEWSPLLIAVIGLSVLLFGFSKTAMPVAGAFAGPLLAAALGPTIASGFVVPLLILGDVIALLYYRSHADWALIRRLVPGVLVGFVIIAVLFRFETAHVIARFLGLLILISVLLELYRLRNRAAFELNAIEAEREQGNPQRWSAAFFGALTGMTTMGANAGGAAMTLYLVKMRVPMLTFMGTSAWFFFVMNLLKVPFVVGLGLLSWQSLLVSAWFVPVLIIGAVGGAAIFRRMNATFFTYAALLLSASAAVWLLVHG